MGKTFITVMVAILAFSGCRSVPGGEEPRPTSPETEITVVDENTNIHYTGRYCDECHEVTPVEGGAVYLKYDGDYGLLCRCHHGMSPGYCHPQDIPTNRDETFTMPSDLPLDDGKITCNTCHDIYRQCRKRLFGRYSLRGAPYPRKTDFCYRCHDHEKYKELNAHLQIQADGKLDIKMCLYCHNEKPDEKTATYEEVIFIGDIKALCRRCHQVEGNHSGNFDHMADPPSAEALQRMELMKEKYNIILPLAEDGKMTCVTCHNPHEKGVIPEDKPSAMGADSNHRQRLPGKMCEACHQM